MTDRIDLLAIIYILNFFVAIFIVFAERKRPSSTLAWIMILYVFPGVGIVCYIILSQLLAQRRLERLSNSMQMRDNPFLMDQKRHMQQGDFNFVNSQAAKWWQAIRFNQEYAAAYLTQNNDITLFTKVRNVSIPCLRIYARRKRSSTWNFSL